METEKIYAYIDEMIIDLLVPARTQKKINQEVFNRFYLLLEEVEKEVKNEEYISRKIAGMLFFIYTSLSAEAKYCEYDDELFIAAAKVEDILERILWESPFASDNSI